MPGPGRSGIRGRGWLPVAELAYRLARHTAAGHGDGSVLLRLDPSNTVLDPTTRTLLGRVDWVASGTGIAVDGRGVMAIEFSAQPVDPADDHGDTVEGGWWRHVARRTAGLLLAVAVRLSPPQTATVPADVPPERPSKEAP